MSKTWRVGPQMSVRHFIPSLHGFHKFSTQAYRNKARKLHAWHSSIIGDQKDRVTQPIPCCYPTGTGDERCGKISFYRVCNAGFCEGHKAFAYQAQANYWQRKYKEIYV